jgi:hypothetical protein
MKSLVIDFYNLNIDRMGYVKCLMLNKKGKWVKIKWAIFNPLNQGFERASVSHHYSNNNR